MKLSNRLRKFRLDRKLSQGDLERLTGLRRQYISRLENGHTTPTLGTLERLAEALSVPVYRFFYAGVRPRKPVRGGHSKPGSQAQRGTGDQMTAQVIRLVSRIGKRGRDLLMATALKMSQLQRG